jgi:hypothetical protein
MDVTTIVALAAGGGVAVAALVTTIILVARAEKPWSLLADERLRRAIAEGQRDGARADLERIATESLQKDKTIDALNAEIARLEADARPAPGHGTDELREFVEAQDAERARASADRGGDPSGPVPRVTATGALPRDPIVSR